MNQAACREACLVPHVVSGRNIIPEGEQTDNGLSFFFASPVASRRDKERRSRCNLRGAALKVGFSAIRIGTDVGFLCSLARPPPVSHPDCKSFPTRSSAGESEGRGNGRRKRKTKKARVESLDYTDLIHGTVFRCVLESDVRFSRLCEFGRGRGAGERILLRDPIRYLWRDRIKNF